MNGDHPWWANLYLMFAAFCGSVTSLSLMQWKTMERKEVMLTLFVGTTFSVFVAPFIASSVFHVDVGNLQALCAAMYFGATGANAFIPMLIKRFTRDTKGDAE